MKLYLKKLLFYCFCSLFIAHGIGLFAQVLLPTTRTEWASTPMGWSDYHTNFYSSSFACSSGSMGKLDDSGDYYSLYFTQVPGILSYRLKKAGLVGGFDFRVEQSVDGVLWTLVSSYSEVSQVVDCELYAVLLNPLTRFLRFHYVTKSTGNIGLDDVTVGMVADFPVITASLSSLVGFGSVAGVASDSKVLELSGVKLAGRVLVEASEGYEVSVDGATFSQSVYLDGDIWGNLSQVIYVRLSASAASGTKVGGLFVSTDFASDLEISLSGFVDCLFRVDGFSPLEGSVRCVIDVRGKGLLSVTRAQIGSADALFEVISDSLVRVAVPDGCVSGKLALTNVCTQASLATFSVMGAEGCNGLADGLFFSEYSEGSSNEKYLEIFNGTGNPVLLDDYVLRVYNNGASSFSNSLALHGILSVGACVVYRSTLATSLPWAIPTSVCNFNGNDAIVLYKTTTSEIVDVFGCVGEDPGFAWVEGGLSTVNMGLVRKPWVSQGVKANPLGGFGTLATEWSSLPLDDRSDLGRHTFSGVVSAHQFDVQPKDETVCDGASADFTCQSGTADEYRWYACPPEGVWGVLPLTNSDILRITDVRNGDSGTQYFCKAISGMCETPSEACMLRVWPKSDVPIVQSDEICGSGDVALKATLGEYSDSVDWSADKLDVVCDSVSPYEMLRNVANGEDALYYVRPSYHGCKGDWITIVCKSLEAASIPDFGDWGASSVRCQGEAFLSFSATASGTVQYNLVSDGTGTLPSIDADSGALQLPPDYYGLISISAESIGCNGSFMSSHVVKIVKQIFTIITPY